MVPYNKTFYFIDGGSPKGAAYEALEKFEKTINQDLKNRHLKVHIVIIPTPRDKLVSSLAKGLGDIAVGNLTITPTRQTQVDFSVPIASNVSEILVTGPNGPRPDSLLALSGKEIYIRESSSYHEGVLKFNKELVALGKPEIKIKAANEFLEDEDILEMVNAGLIPMTIVDSHIGGFWIKIFDKINLHPGISFRRDGEIAWMLRKKTPELKAEVNKFIEKNKKGTLFGNIIITRYLKNTNYIKNNLTDKEINRYQSAITVFKKYGLQYDFDWAMIAALAYQESGIDQNKKSPVGAIGVMQILPSTAGDPNVNIRNIDKIEPNIHAGTKYLRFIVNRYFSDPNVDNINKRLFALASYNAGPYKITKFREEAARIGLNPNIWFHNVEVIAAQRVGRETVQYVSNIFKYYLSYRYIVDQRKKVSAQKQKIKQSS